MATISYTLTLPAQTTPTTADEVARVFGKDIYFAGDYQVGPSGDYVTLEGEAAVKQSIHNRLITKPGEYKAEPKYGVGVMSWIKKRNRPNELQELEQKIIDQLSLETRIEEVVDVFVEPLSNDVPGIKVGIKIRISGNSLSFLPLTFTENLVSTSPAGTDQSGGSKL